jgi:tetratricopeptide (TPR) repeat protein
MFNQGASFHTVSMAAAWGREEAVAGTRLHRLAGRSLVKAVGEDRWALHPLLREFVETRDGVSEAARGRAARHYEGVLRAAIERYKQGGEDLLRGLALFDRQRGHIEAGQAWAAGRAREDEEAARLCVAYPDAGVYVLNLRLHAREWIGWLEAAVAAARRLGDRAAEGVHLGNLGLAYAALGQAQRASEYYERALVIRREIGDRRGEGSDLGNLGLAYADLGQAQRAIAYHEQALEIDREIGDRQGEGNALGNLGIAYADLGQTQRAIEYHEQALVIHREIGDRRGEGSDLGNLGAAFDRLGEVERAIEFYEQALVIRREIGDRRGEGNDLANMGLAYEGLGDGARARDLWRAVLAIRREIGDPKAEKVRGWLQEGDRD